MPRHPDGERAMTPAERLHKHREKLRQAQGLKPDPLNEARKEIAALREQLAAARQKPAGATADPSSQEQIAALTKQLAAAKARIAELEAALASARAEIERLTPKPKAEAAPMPKPKPTPEAQTPKRRAQPTPAEWAATMAQMRADAEAHARERAMWGGRTKAMLVRDIEYLFQGRVVGVPDDVKQIIINAMLPHVREQTNIERGIARRTYRKVLADLHTDRSNGNVAAFVAFKAVDALRPDGKRNLRSIVIADDKVRTRADVERTRQVRSAKAKAAAAARKAARP